MIRMILIGIVFFVTLQSSLQAETPTYENVTKLYLATFDRSPDKAGLQYWVNQTGLTLEEIAKSFFDQEETQKKYPSDTTTKSFVQNVYINLFKRDADKGGVDYWTNSLDNGSIQKSEFLLTAIRGAQGKDATYLEERTSDALVKLGFKTIDFKFSSSAMQKDSMSSTQAYNDYGCNGKNFSPDIQWSGLPEGTKSIAITLYDPDASWWHWVVVNIPVNTSEISEGASGRNMPKNSIEIMNDFGSYGYGGPCPPPGETHNYVLSLYALNAQLNPSDSRSDSISWVQKIKVHTIKKLSITSHYP